MVATTTVVLSLVVELLVITLVVVGGLVITAGAKTVVEVEVVAVIISGTEVEEVEEEMEMEGTADDDDEDEVAGADAVAQISFNTPLVELKSGSVQDPCAHVTVVETKVGFEQRHVVSVRRHPTLAAVWVTQLREHTGRSMIPCAFTSTRRERIEDTRRRSIELSEEKIEKRQARVRGQ